MKMMDYDTFTFEHKSHYNEFAPNLHMEFTTHREENLDELLNMMIKFATACGYSEDAVRQAMSEIDVD